MTEMMPYKKSQMSNSIQIACHTEPRHLKHRDEKLLFHQNYKYNKLRTFLVFFLFVLENKKYLTRSFRMTLVLEVAMS